MESFTSAEGNDKQRKEATAFFQMPLHYPKYSKSEYETMPEWKVDRLLSEYGLPAMGSVEQKRKFAMGAFLWPHSTSSTTIYLVASGL
ncbi:hypothetical protein L484_011462 [Morus notabilis]|uniref:DUF7722 domain-containing protein n=1 Tax=Morus notabilis TaxID=981085 RepID=W9RG80_9ROSA|nr:hypothetical protein L484_011462 [Morus notabilis]